MRPTFPHIRAALADTRTVTSTYGPPTPWMAGFLALSAGAVGCSIWMPVAALLEWPLWLPALALTAVVVGWTACLRGCVSRSR